MSCASRLLWLCVWLVGCGLLPAQSGQIVTDLERRDAPLGVEFRAVTSGRLGGLGYLLVEAQNKSGRTQRLQLGYGTSSYTNGDVRLNGQLSLPAGRSESFCLPLPSIPGASARFSGNGGGVEFSDYFPLADRLGNPDGILLVTLKSERRAQVSSAFAVVLEAVQSVTPDQLPGDWALLSTFRLALIDESVVLGEGPQELLRRFASAGGSVVAIGDQPLGAGPLREQLAAQQEPLVRAGFGLLARAESFKAAAQQLPSATDWQKYWGAVMPSQFVPGEIPGLGGVPVRAFLIIILVFTVAVGPVNFLVLRRRKKQLLAVITVPLLGFGTTAAMLGYGVIQDGFGTQGVVRSVAQLNQQRHEVSASSSQTLFAGVGPRQLEVPVGTVVQTLPSLVSSRVDHGLSAWRYTLGRPALGGELLPSRTVTTLMTTQQQPERARLRFDLEGDRAVLSAEDFALHSPGMLVVRDLEGQHYQERDGGLVPCTESRAADLIDEILRMYGSQQPGFDIQQSRTFSRFESDRSVSAPGADARMLNLKRLLG